MTSREESQGTFPLQSIQIIIFLEAPPSSLFLAPHEADWITQLPPAARNLFFKNWNMAATINNGAVLM